jgi:hypothetical protein
MGYLLSGVALIIQRAFPLKCGLQPLRIIEIIDVRCDSLLDVLTRHLGLPPQEFSFQDLEEAFRDGIIPAV